MTFPIPHHRSKKTALESENQIARVDQSRERIATGKTTDEDLIRFFSGGKEIWYIYFPSFGQNIILLRKTLLVH